MIGVYVWRKPLCVVDKVQHRVHRARVLALWITLRSEFSTIFLSDLVLKST